MSLIIRFTRKELKTKNASDFKQGDYVIVSHYAIWIRFSDSKRSYDTPSLLSLVEDLHTNKFIGVTPGADRPHYIDDFLHR